MYDVYKCMNVHICILYMYVCVCMYVCMYVYDVYMWRFKRVYVCMYMYIRTYVCMYVCDTLDTPGPHWERNFVNLAVMSEYLGG